MRHRLVHEYHNLDVDLLWRVVTEDVPALIAALDPLLPADDAEREPSAD